LQVPHAVSAVTAACLAVEARKFAAVNGFDEDNLPIDLNDIDLCLRLGAKGWRAVLAPDAVLIHREAASRGISHRPYVRYRQEQQTFRARWSNTIRDDPYFHPALSLDALDPRLG
jgi:GT2 family glycosyltransferase